MLSSIEPKQESEHEHLPDECVSVCVNDMKSQPAIGPGIDEGAASVSSIETNASSSDQPEGLDSEEHSSNIDSSAQEKLFLCSHCDKAHPTQSKMLAHEEKCKPAGRIVKKTHNRRRLVGKARKKYPCPRCGKTVLSSQALRNHIAFVHDKVKCFTCTICSREFARKCHLQAHLLSHSDEKTFKCEYCSKQFKSPMGWKNHESFCMARDDIIPTQRPSQLKCFHCPKKFTNSRQRDVHNKAVHDNKPKQWYDCEECGKALRSVLALESHRKNIHAVIKEFFCETCGKGYGTNEGLQGHSCYRVLEKVPECTFCGRRFQTEEWRKKHEKKCKDQINIFYSGDPSYSCENCPETFLTKTEKDLHKKRVHLDVSRFKCTECGASLQTLGSLKHHMKYVHTAQKAFSCSICSKAYKTKGHLTEHQQLTHDKKRPFLCSVCGKGCFSKVALRAHELTHTQKKDFVCSTCGKGFITKTALNAHERWHRPDCPYKCSYCEKTFRTQDCCTIHERYHTGERPYKCEQCDKRFVTRSQEIAHRRVHTGERPYHCTVCPTTYVFSGKLREHHRVKHGLDIPSRKYVPPPPPEQDEVMNANFCKQF